MIVVDASAMVEVLLMHPKAEAVKTRLRADAQSIHAPHLLDIEVAQVCRRFYQLEELSVEDGREVLTELLLYPITRYPHVMLLPTIWRLRDNFTACDAAYIALAEILDAPLVTTDARLARAPGHSAIVDVIS